jgi:hypothetical protein
MPKEPKTAPAGAVSLAPVVVEATGCALLLEGEGAADIVRRLVAELEGKAEPVGFGVRLDGRDALGDPVHGGVRVSLVRSPEVRSATLRIEGRG